MVELRSDILRSRIRKANLYLDKRSLEQVTKIIKPKYKLARSIILEQYIFNTLTKSKAVCKRKLTLTIKKKDWEHKVKGYLKEECSYCDVTKCDILDKSELLKKMRDKRNLFPYVAKLRDEKYRELEKLCERVTHIPYISDPVKEIIEATLSDIVDERAKRLRLN